MIKLVVILGFLAFESPSDSVRLETINGKLFVIHQVDEKETLYAISRRYGTSVESILEYNAEAKAGLEIGKLLKVPYTVKSNKISDGVTHKVEPKETLFSISKQYGVTTDEIKKWNNLSDNSISIGQELIVGKKGNASSKNVTAAEGSEKSNKTGLHTVEAGETMYAIARKYDISVDELKEWNGLQNNEIKVGQSLVVAKTKNINQQESKTHTVAAEKKEKPTEVVKTETTVKKELPVKKEEPVNLENSVVKADNTIVKNTETEKPNIKKEVIVKDPVVKEQPTIKISESVNSGEETVESGLAELIDGTEGNRKYLALHRTAPVGTILKVRNEMNNREVFVRVRGKLEDTALTDKVVIRISKSAYDRLGAIDPKFRVEVTYYK